MMRWATLVLLLAGCAAEEPDWDRSARPAGYAAAPGVGGMVLSGPTVVAPRDPHTWTVTAPDLEIGDRVEIAWGGQQAPGPCPYRRLVGGSLCMDISNPVHHSGRTTAVEDPAVPGAAIAVFDMVVPGTRRNEVHLQAIRVKGVDSATTQPLPVTISRVLLPSVPSVMKADTPAGTCGLQWSGLTGPHPDTRYAKWDCSSGPPADPFEIEAGHHLVVGINGSDCRLNWSVDAGDFGVSGPNDHVAHWDCTSPGAELTFEDLGAGLFRIWTFIDGNQCGFRWQDSFGGNGGTAGSERVAKFDCDGGADEIYLE